MGVDPNHLLTGMILQVGGETSNICWNFHPRKIEEDGSNLTILGAHPPSDSEFRPSFSQSKIS